MYNANGIGLAAIQIGIPKRIVIIDVTKEDEKSLLTVLLIPKLKSLVMTDLHMKKDVCPYLIPLYR